MCFSLSLREAIYPWLKPVSFAAAALPSECRKRRKWILEALPMPGEPALAASEGRLPDGDSIVELGQAPDSEPGVEAVSR